MRKGKEYYVQVYNLCEHEGKIYQTNVIANKNETDEEVYRIAQEQVKKQWANS